VLKRKRRTQERQHFCDIISPWKIVTSSLWWQSCGATRSATLPLIPLRYSFPFPTVQRLKTFRAVSQSLSQSVSRQVKQTEIQFKVILHLLHNSEASAERSRVYLFMYAKRYPPHSAWEIRVEKEEASHSPGPRCGRELEEKKRNPWRTD
jgi:hypothetical protein